MESREPGGQNLDWANLPFDYIQTRSFAKCIFKDGVWGPVELEEGEPVISIHIAATGLHYGQSCFEGLKAFACKDGKVRLFRPDQNAKRMAQSCERVMMTSMPEDRFIQACKDVVLDNLDYVPPYGSGGALYLRPLLFGSGGRIGLRPSTEYTLIILVIPVGDYYNGAVEGVKAKVIDNYDRAAPKGVGNVKVSGNYAADLLPNMTARDEGYPVSLYLDSRTNTCIEEFSISNFVAVNKDGKYITPDSPTILKSITNKSLMALAKAEGITVEHRQVSVTELETFDEICACGTAVVMTPVGSIKLLDKTVTISDRKGLGPVLQGLFNKYRAIQNGEVEDKLSWMVEVTSQLPTTSN